MENQSCCCFGHRDSMENFSLRLHDVIEDLIVKQNVTRFYTGGMGSFDDRFASAVRGFKASYPSIKLTLVRPYLTKELNQNKEWYENSYDGILIPCELAGVHYKGAIQARNRWMVDHSNVVVCYVKRQFGGAYEALRYAERKGKKTILLSQ